MNCQVIKQLPFLYVHESNCISGTYTPLGCCSSGVYLSDCCVSGTYLKLTESCNPKPYKINKQCGKTTRVPKCC